MSFFLSTSPLFLHTETHSYCHIFCCSAERGGMELAKGLKIPSPLHRAGPSPAKTFVEQPRLGGDQGQNFDTERNIYKYA